MEITCDNAGHGCTAVVKLDLLSHHLKDCEFNPRRPVVCTLGCGQSVPKEELAVSHATVFETSDMFSTASSIVSRTTTASKNSRPSSKSKSNAFQN